MHKHVKQLFVALIGLLTCLFLRLIPFRPPNIEPILGASMPFSKKYGALSGFLFASMSILLYDTVTQTLGVWTLMTGLTYGVIGLFAGKFFQKYQSSRYTYAGYAIISTLFFDAVTGLTIGPLFFNQSLTQAFIGQIPFTISHLIGNTFFAYMFSPLIERVLYKKIYLSRNVSITKINIFTP